MAVATIGSIEPFRIGKDDWELYIERFQQYVVANKVEDDRRVATLLTVMGSEAYSLLTNLIAPTKPREKTYDQLVDAMGKHLKPKPLVIAERFKFHRRMQGDQESVSEFMAELRRLADKCRFGAHLEEALRDRLVCGLRSVAAQKKLLAVEDLTLPQAYETAMGIEMATKQAGHLQGGQGTTMMTEPTADSVQVVRRRASQGPPRGQRNFQGQPTLVPRAPVPPVSSVEGRDINLTDVT